MNLLLIDQEDLVSKTVAVLTTAKLQHLRNSQRDLHIGRELRIAIVNGGLGTACITALESDRVELDLTINQDAPTPSTITLLLAIPRPKMLKRILSMTAELGIKQIHLVNCWKTDKAYLQSNILERSHYETYLRKGLEQSCDSVMPQLHVHPRFKPFAEDQLPEIQAGKECLLAQPDSQSNISTAVDISKQQIANKSFCVFIGPEGGFTEYEIQLLKQQGFKDFSFGERVLRVETAICYAIASIKALDSR